jgi:asparagine synthase (glutamine-hydrolysing)
VCGVAGIVSSVPDPGAAEAVGRMTAGLVHRGPDDHGFWLAANGAGELSHAVPGRRAADVVFGSRRLSIVDVDRGAQPMVNEDGSVCVAYNGEIYNHDELRRELERAGHRYRTRCDTETLVHGWEEWGEELFGRLNGIFAVAIADLRAREVVLVRDPLGVKPLYVGNAGRRTWFASELAAADDAGLLPRRLSPDALKLFLTFRFIPSPHTIDRDAWKVPPSHYARVRFDAAGSEPQFVRYHTRIRSSATPRGRKEWGEALIAELDAAVDRQLMSDVPVGSLLSGGVDSSLVTQLMRKHLDYAPHAFAIGLRAEGTASEAVLAERAAGDLGVPFESTLVGDAEFVSGWARMLDGLSEPIANSGALMLELVCEQLGRTHKVALCGQGADELLGGYPRHQAERLYRFAKLVPKLSRSATTRVYGNEWAERLDRVLSAPDRTSRYVEIFSVLPAAEVDGIVRGGDAGAAELAHAVVGRWQQEHDGADPLNDLLRVDARLSLADDLLIVADHCAMRSSVELRVPFLDLAMVDLAERMPSRYKVSPLGERKWLYRRAAIAHLPSEIRERAAPQNKRLSRGRGFATPLWDLFETDGGLLAESDWAAPLLQLPEISGERLQPALGTNGDRMARRRSVLYVLAEWVRANQMAEPGDSARPAGGERARSVSR